MRESARIDGAGEFLILMKIIMPLSKPIIAAIALFTIVGKWNDWYSALIYLNTQDYYPVQMILRKILFNSTAFNSMDPSIMQMFRNSTITPQNLQMATIVVIMLPIMCIYPFIQKYFAAGIMVGGVKG
jgi:ABC transporter, permease protein